MRLALKDQEDHHTNTKGNLDYWSKIPAFCCQAAGGDPDWTEDLTLGWLLFYLAADLMDSVQDADEPDAWWVDQGAGAALAAASGLYFSGSIALNRLHDRAKTKAAAKEITRNFYQTFLVMISGQYNDLRQPELTLEQYWQHAASKSGVFFGLASWAGARLSISEAQVLQAYRDYGNNLGILLQVLDDLDDIRLLRERLHPTQLRKVARSLPVVYALEVSPPETCARVQECLASAVKNQDSAVEFVNLLDQCGSARYVQLEIEKHRACCLRALDQASPLPELKEKLVAFVREM